MISPSLPPESPHSVPTSKYQRRMPSPPRIAVPAPSTEARPLLTHTSEIPAFLRHHSIDSFQTIPSQPLDWKYNNRNEAQAILPFLYLGPSSAGKDINGLRKNGITMVVYLSYPRNGSVRATPVVMKVAEQLEIEAHRVDIASNQALIASFPDTISHITRHLERNLSGKIFICCESGNERSAALVIALIMSLFNIRVLDALQYVQGRRFCVHIDDTTRHLLRSYDDILRARQDVQASNVQRRDLYNTHSSDSSQFWKASCKRFRESDDDVDQTMDNDDIARFQNRSFTPFED